MNNIPLLEADDIEVKIKKVTAKGAIALLYKTARTDMDMLDKVFGPENWQCRYDEIKGNLYCTILVRSESGEWVGKQDCGIESRSDGDGNEKKGEASDAFKRAGFRWGIGRELYTAPFTFLQVPTVPDGNGYKLQNPFARFDVASIGYDENRRINALTIVDDKGVLVFTNGKRPSGVSKGHSKPEDNIQPQQERKDSPRCDVCGSPISATAANSVQQIINGTRKNTGKQMCTACYKAWRKEQQSEAAAVNAADSMRSESQNDDAGDRQ